MQQIRRIMQPTVASTFDNNHLFSRPPKHDSRHFSMTWCKHSRSLLHDAGDVYQHVNRYKRRTAPQSIVFPLDRNSASMPQRQGKRRGVRTNATVRRNEFEHHANRGDFIINKETAVPLSLSKSNRWELLDDEDAPLCVRKMLPSSMTSNERASPFWPEGYHGGSFVDYDRARRFQSVNGKRCDVILEEQDEVTTWIDLSFKDHEYPLQRQLGKKHATPCKCCLRTGGVLVFRGRGKKSFCKTKGMKSYRRKDWNDEFNL